MKQVTQHRRNRGSATILAVVALGLFLIAGIGLAIDGSHLYAQRQMLQAAADAAAQAGVMSLFDKTNTGANAYGSAAFTCTTTDVYTPCYFARQNGVGSTSSDQVDVSFPTSAAGVNLSSTDTPNLVRVTVTRTLTTGLIRMVAPSLVRVKAAGTAAIIDIVSPTPILVTHPTASGSLSLSGNPNISICGGPRRSIQVNSNSATAISIGGSATINLTHAGPPDSGNCLTGTGGDFGVFGGPTAQPAAISLGSGNYIQPSSPILDPLASVPLPSAPATAAGKTALADNTCGCPVSPRKGCNLYSPGAYPTGIQVKGETAVFKPGLYYMTTNGFANASLGDSFMATVGCNPGSGVITADPVTGNGMVVFITGNSSSDNIDLVANSSASLVGDTNLGTYKGMLFFVDRSTTAHKSHNLGGGGALSLTGTIYATNTLATMTANAANFQEITLQGNSGGNTTVRGQIITGKLTMQGTANITMALNPASTLHIRQVALIQ